MRQALFQPESATMSYSEPPDGARNCLPKFVRLGTHREPITDPRDFSVYAVIMSNVTIEREALFNVLSGRHGWPLEEIDAAIKRLVHAGVVDNVTCIQKRRPTYVRYEVPLKD